MEKPNVRQLLEGFVANWENDVVEFKQAGSDYSPRLRKGGLIEGRKPNYFVSASVAKATASVADYIRIRGQDDAFYLKLTTDYLTIKGEVNRAEINQLLRDKLSDVLSEKQKANKISTSLTKLRREGTTVNVGSDTASKWQLAEK